MLSCKDCNKYSEQLYELKSHYEMMHEFALYWGAVLSYPHRLRLSRKDAKLGAQTHAPPATSPPKTLTPLATAAPASSLATAAVANLQHSKTAAHAASPLTAAHAALHKLQKKLH